MTNIQIKIPQLSESISEAVLLKWHIKKNDIVKKNNNLVDIETDKIVLEIPSPDNGKIIEIYKKNGEIVKSNEIIALLNINYNNKEKNIKVLKENLNKNKEKNIKVLKENLNKNKEKNIKVLKENLNKNKENLNKNNILNKVNNLKKIKIKKNNKIKKVKMSNIRICIAKNLINSQKKNATLTTFNEINMQPIINLRNKYQGEFKEKYKIKLGFMSFFVKSVIYTLKKYPILNASLDNKEIIYHNYYNIGIAISSYRGLIVPILKNAENMSIFDIENKILKFIKKIKNNKLNIKELTGGTFTISNGGVFGSMLSTPIISPPQSCILGIHSIKDRVIVENGKILIRPINYFALSYNHCIIDGREAILGLKSIKEVLEDPLRLILKI